MLVSDLNLLARQFMLNAVAVQPADHIWIDYQGDNALALATACSRTVQEAGGRVHLFNSGSDHLSRIIKTKPTAEAMSAWGSWLLEDMKAMQGYIRVCDDPDMARRTASDELWDLYQTHVRKPLTDHRVRNIRWLVVSAPTKAFAETCGMSYEAFQSFYKKVCLLDYSRMAAAAEPLKELLHHGKEVHITGRETDVRLNIEGIPSRACTGTRNIPDGECFTAPNKTSVEGTILFGPSVYEGQRFDWIKLEFKNGKAVKAVSRDGESTRALNRILDVDEGARYVGEFSLAFNPHVLEPVGDILFDEKIAGSLHFALGSCYQGVADNGNVSRNHWDMVHIQRPEHGGGEIWLDGRLIRKDGLFIVPELQALNPDRLAPSVQ